MPFDHAGHWSPPTTVRPSELHAPLPSGHSYQSLVPPFTGQTPGELLDKYYSEKQNDFDWTDPKGVLRKQLEVSLNYPNNVGAPIGSPGLTGKWGRPNGLATVPVPVYGAGSILDGPRAVVEFRNRSRQGPSAGSYLAHFHGETANPSQLEGAHDIVLRELRGELQLIIAWPGYQPERFIIRAVSENGGPLTRFDLGRQITLAYINFFIKVERDRLLPSAVGFYNIALHQGINRRSDSLGVQLSQIRLVRFHNTVGGNWVAGVEIV